jgi:hypothetical protein
MDQMKDIYEKALSLKQDEITRLEAEIEDKDKSLVSLAECNSWLVKGLQKRGDEIIEKRYGGKLPYWAD